MSDVKAKIIECTKFDFGWGFAPDHAGGAYSAPPDPLAGLRGPTSKEREGREMEGMGRKGNGMAFPFFRQWVLEETSDSRDEDRP